MLLEILIKTNEKLDQKLLKLITIFVKFDENQNSKLKED